MLRTAAHVYLRSKKVTLWGDWDLTQEESFDQAVDWLTAQVLGVLETFQGKAFIDENAADRAVMVRHQLDWWEKSFLPKVENMIPVGRPVLGRRFRLVEIH